MSSGRRAANYFKNTQAEAKLRREQVCGEQKAVNTHHDTAKEVRNTIEKLGGTMPENLPSAPPIKQLKKANKPKEIPPSST